ncbi:hypothetical protein ACFL6U_06280 [Planctomycetota bacterium]
MAIKWPLDLTCTVLLLIACLVSKPLMAQDHEDRDPNEEARLLSTASPVEVGIGGNVKRENPYQSEAEDQRPLHVHLLWESRYVTEGRDNLKGDALASLSSEFSVGNFTFAPWVAHGYEFRYTELNLNFIYGMQVTDQLDVYGGYTHLQSRFAGENAHDNEVSFDLAYMPTPWFDLLASYYYSFKAQGGFSELALQREQPLSQKAVLTLRGILGINNGYIVDGHNGLNHTQLRVGLTLYPVSRLEIRSYAAYNFAINRNPERFTEDLSLRDFLWGGIGIICHF